MKQKTKYFHPTFYGRCLSAAALLGILVNLSGCGQKGDLVRPSTAHFSASSSLLV